MNLFAPKPIPTAIAIKIKTNSSGSFIGVLNLTIDKAPTKPKDKARENFITVMTRVVTKDRGINISVKCCLSFKLYEVFT